MLSNNNPSPVTKPVAIHLGGSRALAPSSAAVRAVVAAVLATGASVHVGCAIGADAQVIKAVLAAGAASRLAVFAAFGPAGLGSWSGSAVQVVQAAARAGAAVTWFAGGPAPVPLRARLAQRSAAALRGCAASAFFQPGPGSLAVAARAAQVGQPVFVFASQAPLPLAGQPGQWQPSQFAGLPAFQWVAGQAGLF